MASLIAPDGVLWFPTEPFASRASGRRSHASAHHGAPPISPQGLHFSSEWASLSATLATAHAFNLSSGSGGISLTDPVLLPMTDVINGSVPALGAPNLVAISRHGSIGISGLILEGASTSYGGAVAGANYAVELGSMAGSVKASFSKGQV